MSINNGARMICPYCNSKQTYFKSSQSGTLRSSYSCKNCGHSFALDHSETIKSTKKRSFIGTLFKYLFLLIIVFAAISYLYDELRSPITSVKPQKQDQTTKNEQSTKKELVFHDLTRQQEQSKPQEDVTRQDFPPEAKKPIHEYIPLETKQESIKDSQDQNDTLSIETTKREN